MRLQGHRLAAVTAMVLGCTCAGSWLQAQIAPRDLVLREPSSEVSAATVAVSDAAEYLLHSINTERLMMGMPAVKSDAKLQAAAQEHAQEMARTSTLSHRLEGEADLSARGASAGAHFSRITENVAVGPSIVRMHGALMQSMHHRENILDSQVNSIGIAVVEANGSLWAVEDFSSSVEQLSLDEQEDRVSIALRDMQVAATPMPEARAMCAQPSGYVGARPAFTFRFTTGDLSRLPDQLRSRMQSGAVRSAGVGACSVANSATNFAAYNIAVVVYR